jgi:hypothetical protein
VEAGVIRGAVLSGLLLTAFSMFPGVGLACDREIERIVIGDGKAAIWLKMTRELSGVGNRPEISFEQAEECAISMIDNNQEIKASNIKNQDEVWFIIPIQWGGRAIYNVQIIRQGEAWKAGEGSMSFPHSGGTRF